MIASPTITNTAILAPTPRQVRAALNALGEWVNTFDLAAELSRRHRVSTAAARAAITEASQAGTIYAVNATCAEWKAWNGNARQTFEEPTRSHRPLDQGADQAPVKVSGARPRRRRA